MAAASLGVASPKRMEPSTVSINAANGRKAVASMYADLKKPMWSTFLGLGASEGLMTTRAIT